MKKISLIIFLLLSSSFSANAENDVKRIYEGSADAKIIILAFESLTCSHCADFHKNIYPDLKKNFIDKGIVKLEYRNFPLDLAAFNAAKVAQCNTNKGEEILHFLYKNQNEWVKGNSIEELNNNLEKIIVSQNFGIDYNSCINDKQIEDFVLEDRIEGVKKYNVSATPTIIINEEKFEKPLTYKNLEKTLEKLL
ncbi:DsbA family protein [Candidatus Pelagibacter sp.]|nr:DsbA family protein [Candidatus Pelagibacter sp.]|tara:strand:- start:30 stop:611 length:582 start_codon:yes stop_codon:yes gene_type:complete